MSGFSDVDAAYRHIAKTATPGPLLTAGTAELKWYDLAPGVGAPNAGVATDVRALAQAHVAAAIAEGSMDVGADAGFVILHRCGRDFHFLLTSVWRGANELWESVRYLAGDMTDFAPFAPAYPAPGPVRAAFCVWELGVVAFESRAWSAYLRSRRTEDDRDAWRQSRFTGAV